MKIRGEGILSKDSNISLIRGDISVSDDINGILKMINVIISWKNYELWDKINSVKGERTPKIRVAAAFFVSQLFIKSHNSSEVQVVPAQMFKIHQLLSSFNEIL